MNWINLSFAGCGSLAYLVFLGMIALIVATIKRIPEDIVELSTQYKNQNWSEFRISSLVIGLFWSGSLFCLLFFYSAYTLPSGEYG